MKTAEPSFNKYSHKGTGHPKGSDHWTIRKPHLVPRGGDHWTRRTPDRVPRGEAHWTKRQPSALRRGERVGTAKLTATDVRLIRHAHTAGASYIALATAYDVSYTTVRDICVRRTWVHIQ